MFPALAADSLISELPRNPHIVFLHIFDLLNKFANKKTFYWNMVAIVIVSSTQQNESAICIHISPFSQISFPHRSSQSTE